MTDDSEKTDAGNVFFASLYSFSFFQGKEEMKQINTIQQKNCTWNSYWFETREGIVRPPYILFQGLYFSIASLMPEAVK